LLENSFVLIGFSGDDPNFLAWTGWIRDELGGNHAPIYLVGHLCLDSAERSLLAHRRVTPIDLSPVFAGIQPPNGVHAGSIEWFLNSLSAGRPARPEKWPELDQGSLSAPVSHPPIVDAGVVVPDAVDGLRIPPGPLDAKTVANVIARWRFERQHYPGWLVAPEQKRTRLWRETRVWIEPLTNFAAAQPVADCILLFREVNWRLETSMVPFCTEWAALFQKALDELFDSLTRGVSVAPAPDALATERTSNSELADAWLEVAFGLLRDARESYDASRWHELKGKIDKVVQQRCQYSDRNHYETALWAMWNVERERAKAIISHWQPSPHSPLAVMRKAGLLAELDEVGEARTILRTALLKIRRALRTQGQNIEILSLEGWCTFLLFVVESSLDFTKRSGVLNEFWERWEELKAWDCSPWTHTEYLEEALSAPPPQVQEFAEEIHGFDPGQVTFSTHWGGDDIRPFLPGFACIRLYEQAGVPIRLPMVNFGGDALKNACRWVSRFTGFWSPALLIRAGKVGDLTRGDFLSRAQVYVMDPALAKRLYTWCLQILQRELASLTGLVAMGSAQESILEVLPEVLSRLAFKVDAAELRRTFPLVLYLHNKPGIRSHIRLHNCCDLWFQRLFHAANDDLLLEWLSDLLRGSLPGEGARGHALGSDAWPDPMRHFQNVRVAAAKEIGPDLLAKVRDATDWLLTRAASEPSEGIRRAIGRLICVYQYDARLMSTEQQRQLGELLWSRRASNGLPDLPGFLVFGFLNLPAPATIDITSIIKNYILTLTSHGAFSRDAYGRTSITVGPWEQPFILEASFASKPILQLAGEARGRVEWTQQEAKQLYQKSRDWWANDKQAFESSGRQAFALSGTNPILNTLTRLGDFVARVVVPSMEQGDENGWQELLGWLQEVRSVGGFPTVALPYILLKRPAEAETFAGIIIDDLGSDDEGGVGAAAKATRHWLHLSAMGRIPAPPPNMLMGLIERVIFRRKAGVTSCLRQLAHLVIERPEVITPPQAALVSACLVPWHYATVLPVPRETIGDFPEAERLDLRVLIGRLAGALKIWWMRSAPEEPEPPAVALWRDLCASDPLPEIRRAFEVWDQGLS
jgi:hypothetical protein